MFQDSLSEAFHRPLPARSLPRSCLLKRAAKKPTAREMREAETQAGPHDTREDSALAVRRQEGRGREVAAAAIAKNAGLWSRVATAIFGTARQPMESTHIPHFCHSLATRDNSFPPPIFWQLAVARDSPSCSPISAYLWQLSAAPGSPSPPVIAANS